MLLLASCAEGGDGLLPSGGAGSDPDATTQGSPGATAATAAEGTAAASGAVDDDAALGSAGPVLLSPSVPEAVVEVDRSPGADLAVDPRAVVARALREHGGKTSVAAGADSEVPAKPVYTADDLRAITDRGRGSRSAPGRPAVYVLVLEGRYENERVTGVAFSATAFAVFPDQIGSGALGLDRTAYETSVVVHELGHLFGLVDLTGKGAFHEDPEHQGHSRNESSVMYWAVEDVSIANVFRGGPPQQFDAADREEMARIREG